MKQNIILIMADSLRADHLSCYGSREVNTPNIDRLAEEGVLFSSAFSSGPNTITSVPSFLMSAPPFMLNSSLPTIAEILKKKNYNTASFNPNVQLIWWYCKELKLKRGLDIYDTLLGKTREAFEFPVETLIELLGRRLGKILGKDNFFYLLVSNLITSIPVPIANPAPRAETISQKAVSKLKDIPEPFFLWLFYLDTHEPYLPSQKSCFLLEKMRIVRVNRKLRYFRESLSKREVDFLHELYVREIEQLDMKIGDFIHWLKEKNLYQDTTIIFSADHGEQFMEHGDLGHPPKLYDEQLHVPLIIKTSSSREKIRVETPVSLLDLAPTIAEAAEIREGKSVFLGQSLFSLFSEDSIDNYQQRPMMSFANYHSPTSGKRHYCYRTNKWKLIVEENERELYDLNDDPKEKRNVSDKYQEIVKKLESEAQDYISHLIHLKSKTETEKHRIKRLVKKTF